MVDLRVSVLVSQSPLFQGRDGRLASPRATALPASSWQPSLIDGRVTLSTSFLPVASGLFLPTTTPPLGLKDIY